MKGFKNKGQNLIERKKAQDNIKEIIKNNVAFQEFLVSFQGKHLNLLDESEIETFKNLNLHLANMSLIFNNLLVIK
ncbi:hypothetical protein [Heyndrickxia oleronia]|uniref:hypothetical protein n=1 Tax=Heyndrickxia oleronia TaxID=38875 RepID=UPI0037530BCC